MNVKKAVILIAGLVLPVGIFFFLKIFGENKFEVQPLFQTELPALARECGDLQIPYAISPEIVTEFNNAKDVTVVMVGNDLARLSRLEDQFSHDDVSIVTIDADEQRNGKSLRDCIFLLHPPYDVVMFDKQGVIRGQYFSEDREEVDRLIIEIEIMLNK